MIRKCLVWCLSLSLLLGGCGAALTGASFFLFQNKDSSSAPLYPPVVSISSPSSGADTGGLVEIRYTLYDADSTVVSITVEWSTDQINWYITTELKETVAGRVSDGTVGLSASASGEDHRYIWNSFVDLPAQNQNVAVRIRPIDASGLAGDPVEVSLQINNKHTYTVWGHLYEGSEKDLYAPAFVLYRDTPSPTLFLSNHKTNIITRATYQNSSVQRKQEVGNLNTFYNGDNLPGVYTNLNQPGKMVFARDRSTGNPLIIFCDTWNHRVRVYDLTTQLVRTIAGNGSQVISEYDRPFTFNLPTDDSVATPRGVSVQKSSIDIVQTIVIADSGHRSIRFINWTTQTIDFAQNTGFYNGSYSVNGVPLTSISIEPNEIRTVVGNYSTETVRNTEKNLFYTGPLTDPYPLWCHDASSLASTEQYVILNEPQAVVYLPATSQHPPLLFVADDRGKDNTPGIYLINLGGISDSTVYVYTSVDIPPAHGRMIFGWEDAVNFAALSLEDVKSSTDVFATAIRRDFDIVDLAVVTKPDGKSFTIFFTDVQTNAIYRIDTDTGYINHVAGASATTTGSTSPITSRDANNGVDPRTVRLRTPFGLDWIPSQQILLLVEMQANRIRAINLSNQTQNFFGKTIDSGNMATILEDRIVDPTELFEPDEVLADPDNPRVFYLVDQQTKRVLEIHSDTYFTTVVAGKGAIFARNGDFGDGGPADEAVLDPIAIGIWKDGSKKLLVIADKSQDLSSTTSTAPSQRIRIVNLGNSNLSFGTVTDLPPRYIHTLVGGGTNTPNPFVALNPGDVNLQDIRDVAFDTGGTLYIVEENGIVVFTPSGNREFRNAANYATAVDANKVLLLSSTNIFTRITPVGGAATTAATGNLVILYPSLSFNTTPPGFSIFGINFSDVSQTILGVTIPPASSEYIAGGGLGYNGDFISFQGAWLNLPYEVRYYRQSTGIREILLISDMGNNRIRAAIRSPGHPLDGLIVSLVGTDEGGYNGDGLPDLNTMLNNPVSALLYPEQVGNTQRWTLVLVDRNSFRLRRLVPSLLER